MNRQRWEWAGLLVGWAILWPGTIAWAGDDFQSWSTLELAKKMGKSFEIFFLPEIRLRDDASTLFYHEYRQGLRWKPSQHLEMGLNHLFVRNESSGKPRDEHTGELNVTPKTKWGPLDLSLRGRVALRTIERSAGEQEWQLRCMPKIALPTKVAGHPITPYIADDLFYDYTRDAFNQNRFFLGVGVPLGKAGGAQLHADFYYMLQSQLGKRHDWNSNHILGTKLSARWD